MEKHTQKSNDNTSKILKACYPKSLRVNPFNKLFPPTVKHTVRGIFTFAPIKNTTRKIVFAINLYINIMYIKDEVHLIGDEDFRIVNGG